MSIVTKTINHTLTIISEIVSETMLILDSYGTLNAANIYFSNKLRTLAWRQATTDDKRKGLMEATRILDTLAYLGTKQDPTQFHQFPRYDDFDNDIGTPKNIEFATYEIALKLIQGIDPDTLMENVRIKSRQFSRIQTTYSDTVNPEYMRAGVPSATAWQLIKPYLRDVRSISLERVN